MNTTAVIEDEAERTVRYWNAVIACLSTPEKRSVAEELLRRNLEGGHSADTLFALIVLLEANGAFLLKLPEKLHGEFTRPLADQLGAFKATLLAHDERQQEALGAFDKTQHEIAATAALIEQNRQELARKIQMAAGSLDPSTMANSISRTLETTILQRLKLSLGNLEKSTEQAIQAGQTAERSVHLWRQVHLRGIALTSILLSALLAASILCWGWWKMEDHYRARLAAQVVRLSATDDAYRQLLALGVSIGLAPRVDEAEKPVADGYTITIDQAETATVQTTASGSRAIVTLQAQPLAKRLESFRKDVDKLQSNLRQEQRKSR